MTENKPNQNQNTDISSDPVQVPIVSDTVTVTETPERKETLVEFAVRIHLSDPQSDSADYRACDDMISALSSTWEKK